MLKEGLTATDTNGDRQNGDAKAAIAGAAKKVEAIYPTPFLSHACMEMMNATVRLSPDKAELLGADAERRSLARGAVGDVRRAARQVRGATGTTSAAASAGAAARRTTSARRSRSPSSFPGTPVKLIWSREEDQAHDFFRPISQCKMSAGLDEQGNLVGLHVRVSGQSINATLNPAGIVGGKDKRQLQG